MCVLCFVFVVCVVCVWVGGWRMLWWWWCVLCVGYVLCKLLRVFVYVMHCCSKCRGKIHFMTCSKKRKRTTQYHKTPQTYHSTTTQNQTTTKKDRTYHKTQHTTKPPVKAVPFRPAPGKLDVIPIEDRVWKYIPSVGEGSKSLYCYDISPVVVNLMQHFQGKV